MPRPILLLGFWLAGPALAGEAWLALDGAAIGPAVAARHLVFADGATRQFNPDGSAHREGAGAGAGRWRVVRDRLCEFWFSQGRWDCHGVERSADGLSLRFSTEDGSAVIGRYDDL
jgi:hypothetical protein